MGGCILVRSHCLLEYVGGADLPNLDHCIEYLRQRLMCIADMNLLPYIWLGDDGDMVSDMTGNYTCRNYESLRSFVEKNGEAADGRVKPKPGELVLYDYV